MFNERDSAWGICHCILQLYCGLNMATAVVEMLQDEDEDTGHASAQELASWLKRAGLPAIAMVVPTGKYLDTIAGAVGAHQALAFQMYGGYVPGERRWGLIQGLTQRGVEWLVAVGGDEPQSVPGDIDRAATGHMVMVTLPIPKLAGIVALESENQIQEPNSN